MRDPGFVPEVGYLNSVSCTRVFYPALIKSDPGYGVDFPVRPLLTLSRSHQIGPWLWCRLSSTTFTHPFPLSSNRTLVMVQTFQYDLYSPFPALIKSDPGYGADFPVRPLLTLPRSHQIGPWLWCRLSSTTFTHPSPLSSNRTLVMV